MQPGGLVRYLATLRSSASNRCDVIHNSSNKKKRVKHLCNSRSKSYLFGLNVLTVLTLWNYEKFCVMVFGVIVVSNGKTAVKYTDCLTDGLVRY